MRDNAGSAVLAWQSLPVSAGQALTLLQLTDLHLCADVRAELLGIPVDSSFRAVLAEAVRDYPTATACLLTGDLADDGSAAAYQRLAQHTRALPWPVFWLPGNHDDVDALQANVPDAAVLQRCLIAGDWRIILLDSSVPGEVGGALGDAEYRLLELALMDCGQHPVLVVIHHPACDSGTAWIDSQQLADGARFWDVIGRYPNVKGLLCGHIHQAIDRPIHGVRWLASPSTCVQFAPGATEFRVDNTGPGYRWLTLQPDGGMDTGVRYLAANTFSPASLQQRETGE